MLRDKSSRLWQSVWGLATHESDFPFARSLFFLAAAIFNGILISIIIIKLLSFPIEIYSTSFNVGYFSISLIAIELIFIASLFICTYTLSLNRYMHDRSNLIENILCEIKESSYVIFLWLSLILSPLLALFTIRFVDSIITPQINAATMIPIFIGLCVLFIVGGYRKITPEQLRFAPGTTDIDELGFKDAAQHDMRRLVDSDQHILIANINGRLGEGKSTYLRLMMGSQKQKDFLYSYISLTETNETKSFSKLFAERWSETINNRYPSITNSAKNSVLDNIFRESKNTTLLVLRSLFSSSRWPLKRTKITRRGDNYPIRQFAPRTIASLFSFVPHFKEKFWVIVIDEVERARFDEIYRTVETLERFRIESQWGLPIQLIFILCTDRLGFRLRANSAGDSIETARLTYSFFEVEPKTIDVHIDLPPVAPDVKQDFILSKEKSWLLEPYDINTNAILHPDDKEKVDLKAYWSQDMVSGSDFDNGRLDDKKAHDFMLQTLMKESPRSIKKILEDTERFLRVFIRYGKRSPDQIRVSDLILLHYLKYKFPESIRFLYNTHYKVFPEFHNKFKSGEISRMLSYFSRNRDDSENKVKFSDFFLQETGLETDQNSLHEIEKTISIICYPIIQYVNSLGKENPNILYEYSSKPNYDRTLGLPENMWDALKIATEDIQDGSEYLMTQRLEIYTNNHKKLPSTLVRNGTKLLVFARNMRRFYPGDYVVSRVLAQRIAKVISTNGLIRRYPGTLFSDSPYHNLLYVFTFHLSNYLNRDDADDSVVEEAYMLLKMVLESDETMLEGKLTIINTLFVYSQSNRNGSIELDNARKKIESLFGVNVTDLIRKVMNEGLDKYMPPKGKSIYDYEENYFYALYQMWSGDPNDIDGIAKIRKVALNGLKSHHKVIGQYWEQRYQSKDTHLDNPSLQIELKDLIKVTKEARLFNKYKQYIEYWTKDKSGDRPIQPATLKEGFATVRLQLVKLGYLDK
jgi:hypothetical protein